MSDQSGKQRLLSYLAEDRELWTILPLLAGTPATELREALRPHDETGISLERNDKITVWRKRLDKALDALTLLEIAYETGVVTIVELPVPELESLKILFRSGAVLRYVNAYLYFGIRFLACRIAPETWFALPQPAPESAGSTNRQIFALAAPPSFVPDVRTAAAFAEFISLSVPPGTEVALSFLDGWYVGSDEVLQYDLWLRGLRPDLEGKGKERFFSITAGLLNWAKSRTDFYLSLQPVASMPTPPAAEAISPPPQESDERPLGGWIVVNPVAARFALADAYWLARLLRADVTTNAGVTYPHPSWLRLLRFEAALRHDQKAVEALRKMEEVMRSVFDFVCDLVQNAVDVSVQTQLSEFEHQRDAGKLRHPTSTTAGTGANGQPGKSQDKQPNPCPNLARWRRVFDEELAEIMEQRVRRSFPDPGAGTQREGRAFVPSCPADEGWSERLTTGRKPQNLIGLAFSGGGIRSATFNLGVLQALQAFDQLRYVDYLSTVSGGGFVGSWLVGNVKRTQQWLGRLTCWDESIAHLRAYSNYLAPRSGVLSADPWTIAASWARNAFLIQLTAFSWLLVLLLGILIARLGFVELATASKTSHAAMVAPQFAAFIAGLLTTIVLAYNFILRTADGKHALGAEKVRYLAVLPAWLGAFFVSLHLWSNAAYDSWSNDFDGSTTYSDILFVAYRSWKFLLALYFAALLLTLTLSLFTSLYDGLAGTSSRKKILAALRAFGRSFWVAFLCLAVLYLGLSAVLLVFISWKDDPARFGSYAFVFGPALVLACFTLSITLLIGLSGRASNEAQREWWTRFGTWVAIYAGIGLVLSAVAVIGPDLLVFLSAKGRHPGKTVQWGTLAGWLGTVVAGLFSGKSSRTSGDKVKSPWLEILAQLGGFLFIVGAVLGASASLYLLLLKLGTTGDNLETSYWTVLQDIQLPTLLGALLVLSGAAILFSWYFEINIFGLNQFYRNRVVRCYLGASRWALGERSPHPFTKFDFKDDLKLADFAEAFRGPFPIFNCTLNLAGSSDLALHTRHSASFSLTPFRCGADRPLVGYAPTATAGGEGFAGGVMLGQAVAISGAAASPNMGYNTSPLVAFLLTMFNVRLGWWFPNPGKKDWNHRGMRYSLGYLVNELFGLAGEKRRFLNVSDGGHFENLGIYELVRRRCKVIIACDAECDELLQFGGLGNVIRLCKTDFNATIDIDVKSIRDQRENASIAHCTVGRITYSNGSIGYLLYVKASITGDEDVSVAQYRSSHPTFPHETTADQFFSEDQFESYRRLGQHIVSHALRGAQPGDHPVLVAERLADVMAPAGCNSEVFLKHARVLDHIWERFRQSPTLAAFLREITGTARPVDALPTDEELCLGLEMLQLMEDVFMDLRLDDFWDHPDNRGWAMLFMQWARSPRFRGIWSTTNRTFGIRFEYFCDARLGLMRDRPILRV